MSVSVPTDWIYAGILNDKPMRLEVEMYNDAGRDDDDDACGDETSCVWSCCECGDELYTCGCCGHIQDDHTARWANEHVTKHPNSRHVRVEE